eukprot:1142571-Pelagomonas_calceolata.AAC.4
MIVQEFAHVGEMLGQAAPAQHTVCNCMPLFGGPASMGMVALLASATLSYGCEVTAGISCGKEEKQKARGCIAIANHRVVRLQPNACMHAPAAGGERVSHKIRCLSSPTEPKMSGWWQCHATSCGREGGRDTGMRESFSTLRYEYKQGSCEGSCCRYSCAKRWNYPHLCRAAPSRLHVLYLGPPQQRLGVVGKCS